jgi:cbb3-type cytochrome oxidase maturation protein
LSAIILLIFFSLIVAIWFLIAFLWAVRSGQYDDQYTPSVRILFDDNPDKKETKAKNENI